MDSKDKTGVARPVETTEQASMARADRRRMLLKGLNKSSVVLAAAAPITSFAGNKVPSDDGNQCTVSGQMSKLLSQGAAVAPCGGHHCSYFVKCEKVAFTSCPDSVKRSACKNVGGSFEYGTGSCVYVRTDSTYCRKLSCDTSWPTSTVPWNTKCQVVGGLSTKTFLQQVYESPESDVSYCIGGYLNAAMSATPPTGYQRLPFDKSYVQTAVSGSVVDSAKFFRKTCVKNKRTFA